MSVSLNFLISALCILFVATNARKVGYVPFDEPIKTIVNQPQPHTYLSSSELPESFDWRKVNGTNFGSKVLTQQNPSVCGSCWAEAATGALSDRYTIATGGRLRFNLAPQTLLNYNARTSGGSCNGGDHLKAYDFAHKFGLADDTCAPFLGLNWARGFEVAAMTEVDDVRAHQCYICNWNGVCSFVKSEDFDLYGADEFGSVLGEQQMMAEIYARGPIACSLNSEVHAFDQYSGGVINCNDNPAVCATRGTDHVIVIAGWGVDPDTKVPYWVGRNSYGTQWGEGSGGGWFRLHRGVDALSMESSSCAWAVPAAADVNRAIEQYESSLAK